jgi:cell division protein FtsN
MPKDFKNNPPPRESNGRVGHPMLLGIIIGLLMGIVIALAVALWLNRLSNPFVDKARPIEPLARIGPTQPPKPEEKGAAPAKGAERAPAGKPAADKPAAEKKPTDRPRFEFYTMLPGEKEVSDKEAKAAAKPKEPAKAGPGSSPAQPKPHSGETYWLQAGAFAEEKDADNLKAKIALTGLEATVKGAEIAGKGTLYRVRLGPYQSLEDANRIKTALSQNGVGATIIRTDEAKNP